MDNIPYDRKLLENVLVYHYRNDNRSCGCGWAELGKSYPQHVATIYEESISVMALRSPYHSNGLCWCGFTHSSGGAEEMNKGVNNA